MTAIRSPSVRSYGNPPTYTYAESLYWACHDLSPTSPLAISISFRLCVALMLFIVTSWRAHAAQRGRVRVHAGKQVRSICAVRICNTLSLRYLRGDN